VSTTKQDRAKQQRRVAEISDAILRHAAELEELAGELVCMGCHCDLVALTSGGWGHGESCPLFVACQARDLGSVTVELEPGKSVRHLAEPFRADGGSGPLQKGSTK